MVAKMATFSNSLIRIKSSNIKFIYALFYQQNSITKSALIVLQNTHKKRGCPLDRNSDHKLCSLSHCGMTLDLAVMFFGDNLIAN
jgi:hypothetical protein